jgi:hypothetical protein
MGKAISDNSDNNGYDSSNEQYYVDWVFEVFHDNGIEGLDLWWRETVRSEYLLSELLCILVVIETRILIRDETSNECRDASELLNNYFGGCNCIGAIDNVPVVICKYLT